jgi:uncharacterized damage-inducible protein DinB
MRRRQEVTMTLQDVLTQEAEATYAVTRQLFRRVSDADLGWKPASHGVEWMTTGQLLMHCAADACGKSVQAFVTGDWGPVAGGAGEDAAEAAAHLPAASALPAVESVEEALALLEEDRTLALRWIAAAGEERLMGARQAAPWGGAPLTLFQHLLHMIAHLAQHKGQLFYYLKLMGRDVRTPDLWGA